MTPNKITTTQKKNEIKGRERERQKKNRKYDKNIFLYVKRKKNRKKNRKWREKCGWVRMRADACGRVVTLFPSECVN